MRLDKYLKNSRLIKRRTVAKEACDEGRVTVNGRKVKAGQDIDIGDMICIEFGNGIIKAKVTKTMDVVRKEDATSMYEIIE